MTCAIRMQNTLIGTILKFSPRTPFLPFILLQFLSNFLLFNKSFYIFSATLSF